MEIQKKKKESNKNRTLKKYYFKVHDNTPEMNS